MDRKDLRMGKSGSDPDFPEESLRLVPLRVTTREQHLQRDLASVLQILRQIDGCHAAAADLFFDPVAVRHCGT
jgi:hypothetical protein